MYEIVCSMRSIGSSQRQLSRLGTVLALAGAALVGLLTLAGPADSSAARPSPPAPAAAEPVQGATRATGATSWRLVLERLSDWREQAWAQGRAALLRRVYDPSSLVLRKDAFMLSRYVDRGLRVRGVDLAFGRVKLQRRQHGTVWLQVTDQLGPAAAVSANGRRIALPRDEPSRHLIVLRRRAAHWRILAVRP
jgi:hypothetical protein